MPTIEAQGKPGVGSKASPKTNNQIQKLQINVDYVRGSQKPSIRNTIRAKITTTNVKELERGSNYGSEQFEDDVEEEEVGNGNAKNSNLKDVKKHHYLSLNESGLKTSTKEVTANRSTNITKFMGERGRQQSLFKSSSKRTFEDRKSRLSVRKEDEINTPSKKYSNQVSNILPDPDLSELTSE